jgi:hypothetical protein
MAYEAFTKKKERKRRACADRPLMVSMSKDGRLTLNQGFFPLLMQHGFKKAEVMIDYQSDKIGLKMLTEDVESSTSVKKIIQQTHRTKLTFVSFTAVKTKLNLQYPFIRHATWDDKNKMIEFSFKEEKHA